MTDTLPDTLVPHLHGELLVVPERVVPAPIAGVFTPAPPHEYTTEGEIITAGQSIGVISRGRELFEVVSPFTGFFMGHLACDGERVRPGQPLLWLRVITP